jgi:hypothetical protein
MTPIFAAIVQDGHLIMEVRGLYARHLQSLEGKRVTVTVEKEKRKRSNQQNKYYWGVVLQLIAEHTGEDPENIHEALKAHFAPKHVVGNIVIPSATRYLDTIDFSTFVEKVARWAAEELGIMIPLPGEVALG